MDSIIKVTLSCGVALIALMGSEAAAAQEATTKVDTGSDSQATTIQAELTQNNDPNTIVVTANKRAQSLIKVPQSLTAISGDDLLYRNESRIEDFASQVPGFNLQSFGVRAVKLVLRGVNSGGYAATTAVVIDETPFSYQSGLTNGAIDTANLDTFDMNRIEVLKGPQGTLYGASAEGGLLKYVTNRPDPRKFAAALETSAETVDQGGIGGSVKGMVNIPFWGGRGAIRASGFYTAVPGFIDNPLAGRENANHGHRYGGRISILLQPTDTLTFRLTGSRQDQRFYDNSFVEVVGANLDPLNPPANQYVIANGGRLAQNSYYGNPSHNSYEYLNATVDWDAGFADLLSSTSYGKLSSVFRNDVTSGSAGAGLTYGVAFGDGYPTPLAIRTRQTNAGDRWNQEIRITSKPDAHLGGMAIDWLVGGFFAHETNTFDQFFQFVNVPTGEELTSPAPGGGSTFPSKYEEFSGFGNATVHLTDQLFVQGGARYAHVTQSSLVTNYPGFFTGVSSVIVNPQLDSTEHKITWSGQVGYNFDDASLLYTRVATGYRSGGPQSTIPGAPADLPLTYKPDNLTNYEIGLRTSFFAKMLNIDVAAFYIDWKDIQITSRFLSSVNGVAYDITGNAGSAKSKGAEWTVTLNPIKGLSVTDSGAYTHAYLTVDAIDLGALKGQALAFVPRWSNTLNVDYQTKLSGQMKGFAGISWEYLGGRYSDFSLFALASHVKLPSYNSVNGQIGVDFGRYSASLYARNIANERGITTYSQGDGYNFTGTATIIQPRTVGIKLTAKL